MIEGVRSGIGALGAALAMLLAAAVVVAEAPKSTAETLVELYVPMQEALAGDSAARVKEQAAKVAAESAAGIQAGGEEKLLAAVAAAAKRMTASDIETLREQFKPLSTALARVVEKQPVSGHGIYFCPMADAYWVQKQGSVANPYYGKSMLRCGELVKKVEG